MSSQKLKFETNSYCVGGKHHSGTKNISGEITINKKTNKEIKLLVGKCMVCNRKKSRIVSDNTIKAEGLGSFFKNLGKISSKVGKKLATNVLKNLGRFSVFVFEMSYHFFNVIDMIIKTVNIIYFLF